MISPQKLQLSFVKDLPRSVPSVHQMALLHQETQGLKIVGVCQCMASQEICLISRPLTLSFSIFSAVEGLSSCHTHFVFCKLELDCGKFKEIKVKCRFTHTHTLTVSMKDFTHSQYRAHFSLWSSRIATQADPRFCFFVFCFF